MEKTWQTSLDISSQWVPSLEWCFYRAFYLMCSFFLITLQHLLTFSLQNGEVQSVEEAQNRLSFLAQNKKLWSQQMYLDVGAGGIYLKDVQSQVRAGASQWMMKRFKCAQLWNTTHICIHNDHQFYLPLQDELESYAFRSIFRCEAVNTEKHFPSLLMLVCQGEDQKKPDIHFFNCETVKVSADGARSFPKCCPGWVIGSICIRFYQWCHLHVVILNRQSKSATKSRWQFRLPPPARVSCPLMTGTVTVIITHPQKCISRHGFNGRACFCVHNHIAWVEFNWQPQKGNSDPHPI